MTKEPTREQTRICNVDEPPALLVYHQSRVHVWKRREYTHRWRSQQIGYAQLHPRPPPPSSSNYGVDCLECVEPNRTFRGREIWASASEFDVVFDHQWEIVQSDGNKFCNPNDTARTVKFVYISTNDKAIYAAQRQPTRSFWNDSLHESLVIKVKKELTT